ncbi:MAG: DUF2796 domain-containing protein [Hyphomonadaceae bacterium]|nr:DUF2796 domain-containing protein [Hyphomonadaceae bacterium]
MTMRSMLLMTGAFTLVLTGVPVTGYSSSPESQSGHNSQAAGPADDDTSVRTETAPGSPSDSDAVTREGGDVRSAGRHVHGVANLALVLEGETVTVELESPAFNILGFEHAPETDAQKTAVRDAEVLLREPGKLIMFNSEAGCVARTPESPFELHTLWEGHDGKDHGHDGHHADDHAGDEHDDHKDEHTSVMLSYEFSCSAPDNLREVDLAVFETFPNFTEIGVVFLGPDSQRAFNAGNRNQVIRLRGN